jgi:hypothetical protein
VIARFFLSPVPAIRAVLVSRVVWLIFAFDAFSEHLRPAWRYGLGDVFVPHFAILEPFARFLSGPMYVGLIFASGTLAWVCAWSPRAPFSLRIALALAYFASWSLSMHDSYQHHYLLSWLFVLFAVYPSLSAFDLFGPPAGPPAKQKHPQKSAPPGSNVETRASLVPLASNWALVATQVIMGIVYAYTTVTKLDESWWSGATLRGMTHDGENIPDLVRTGARLGLDGNHFWVAMSVSVIVLEVVIALAYVLTPIRERTRGHARIALEVLMWSALALALGFHSSTGYLELKIGWFSRYMIAMALATLLPASWLGGVWLVLSWPARALAADRVERGVGPSPAGIGFVCVLAGVAWFASARFFDLPGATGWATFASLAALVLGGVALARPRALPHLSSLALALGLAAPLALSCLRWGGASEEEERRTNPEPHHDVRYDFWRLAGGDHRRRGEWALALDAYRHANRYAPRGHGREQQEREMEERVRTEGPRSAR